ncbi:helix-turn-helix transcriptional regulator [Microbacterium sp. A93]|uniref:helix-turn-helix transcriptional regulator n=1 Tax=Microbacterium sp. A93 TaxID=3450716 RepID=UPI003F42E0DA
MVVTKAGNGAVTGLTALTSFIGRRGELAQARERMAQSRLVTLTGPGGIGKSRLAAELAHRARKSFRDGVYFVELANLPAGAAVAPAVASSLQVPDQSARAATDRVLDFLRDRELLMVLDNCEHVLADTVELVQQILAEAPGVSVLATGREQLGLAGEFITEVPPLAVPGEDFGIDALSLGRLESVILLVDRARTVDAGFAVTEDNQEAVARICTQLDGMPLAIELAATRLRSLSIHELADRLDQRFTLLNRGDRGSVPRQRTLESLIDWSYQLCAAEEQLLWKRLSVFQGGFDLEAAEDICSGDGLESGQVLDVLDRLVAKSVVQTKRSATRMRYLQLMTVREFAAERLVDERPAGGGATETDRLRRRHRDHYLERAVRMVEDWAGPDQASYLGRSRDDHANLLSALDWSLSTPGEEPAALKLGAFLKYHWIAGGFLADGREWLDRVLARAGGHGETTTPERGFALTVLAWVALIQGDTHAAAASLDEARVLATALGDAELANHVRTWTANVHMFRGELDEAIALYLRAVEEFRARGLVGDQLTSQFQLGMAQVMNGDPGSSLATCHDALATAQSHGELWSTGYAHWVCGLCHWHQGDLAEARVAGMAALAVQRIFHDTITIALVTDLLSWVEQADAGGVRSERAEVLSAAAGSMWRSLGTDISAFGPQLESQAVRGRPPRRAGKPSNALREASVATAEQVIAIALGDPPPSFGSDPDRRDEVPNPLTPKENEVAGYVTQGMTNRLIAQKLVVSPRTIDGHVERILSKLDFTSRAQIAAWVEGGRG